MIAVDIETDVPENREVLIKLPPEVPVGRVMLEVRVKEPPIDFPEFTVELDPSTIRKAFPPRPTHPKLAEEHDAFERMLPELMREHAGKHAAVHEQKVVAISANREELLRRVAQDWPSVAVLVRLITDQPEPVARIPSPREVRRTPV